MQAVTSKTLLRPDTRQRFSFFIEYTKDLRIFMIKVKKLVTDNTLQASALG